jgi:type I restriction enzyme, S subunit
MSAIPAGYKQTEVGVIPGDWHVALLGELATTSSGTTPARAQADRFFTHGTVRWVKTLDLTNGPISETEEAVTPAALAETCLQIYPIETVLVAMYGGYNQIGRTGLLEIQACVNQALTAVQTNRKKLHPRFLLNILNYRVDYWRTVASSSRKDPNITSNDIRAFAIAVPPIAEQQAIAEALSDADALIESLEQLLTKKRHLKQAAMQEFLTGKKRLPGFSGEWEVKKLEELAEIRSGGTPSTTEPEYWDGDVLWCTPTDITGLKGFKYLSDTSRKITPLGLKASSAEIIPSNSVVMTSRATIGECAINKVPISTNQGFKNFVPFDSIDADFLFYILLTQQQGFICLCGGSTFLEIGKTQLAMYEVRVPKTKAEQTAIAIILSNMDTEIADLETQLDKSRAIKQGMMQKLLTGEIRLI